MVLKVHHPEQSTETISIPTDRKKLAEQMMARLIAEVKQTEKLDESKFDQVGALAAAMKLIDEAKGLRGYGEKVKLREWEFGKVLLSADPATQKQTIFFSQTHLARNRYTDPVTDRVCEALLNSLLRKKLEYSQDEIEKLLFPVTREDAILNNLPVQAILANVERHVDKNGLHPALQRLLQRMSKQYHSGATYSDARKVGKRVEALLAQPSAKQTKPVVKSATSNSETQKIDISTGEAWTNALLEKLDALSSEERLLWNVFLLHCGSAKSSKPTKKFFKQAQECLDSIGRETFIQVVTPALLAIGQPGKPKTFNYGGRIEYGEATEIHDTHVDRLRGLVWTTSLIDDADLIGVVGDAAEKCFQKIRDVGPRSPKIGNACLIALSALASETAVAQLSRLQSRARHTSTRKQIAKAFQQAAENAGMTEADLIELGVPTFGMNDVGSLHEDFGDAQAKTVINANSKPQTKWIKSDGKPQKSVPKSIKESQSEQLKQFKKRLKDIEKLMPAIRQRIERLFTSHREWCLADFRKRYLDHPLVGVIARKLIWNVEYQDRLQPVFWYEGNWTNSNGEIVEVDADSQISIWHPLHCEADDVLRWREWLQANQIVQPFKQAHREIYILTDAERATVDHSRRFESHIIRQHQFAALCQQRGWRFNLQGEWDSWNFPYFDLPQHGLQARFTVDPIEGQNDVTQNFVYTFLATEHVSFARLIDGQAESEQSVLLEEIPAMVFSEVMRDVDLFVGVTSIGNDPEWLAGETEAEHQDYWQKFSFGELSQAAVMRKQTLEQILTGLDIADQCKLDGRFLIVEGKLRTYKIHLGSGNILMSPDDRYLCIVQRRGSGAKRTDNLYLPFEGDNTLSLILSKAFLLAEDHKIKDPTIQSQIRRT